MDTSTVVFVSGIISCIIGVASFITGMVSRARNDGKLEAKLGFCLQGIEEIKNNIQGIISKQGSQNEILVEHNAELKRLDERLNILEREFNELRK